MVCSCFPPSKMKAVASSLSHSQTCPRPLPRHNARRLDSRVFWCRCAGQETPGSGRGCELDACASGPLTALWESQVGSSLALTFQTQRKMHKSSDLCNDIIHTNSAKSSAYSRAVMTILCDLLAYKGSVSALKPAARQTHGMSFSVLPCDINA